MSHDELQGVEQSADREKGAESSVERKEWQEPKLAFVKPTLTQHGKLAEVTGQFFGAFSPGTD